MSNKKQNLVLSLMLSIVLSCTTGCGLVGSSKVQVSWNTNYCTGKDEIIKVMITDTPGFKGNGPTYTIAGKDVLCVDGRVILEDVRLGQFDLRIKRLDEFPGADPIWVTRAFEFVHLEADQVYHYKLELSPNGPQQLQMRKEKEQKEKEQKKENWPDAP